MEFAESCISSEELDWVEAMVACGMALCFLAIVYVVTWLYNRHKKAKQKAERDQSILDEFGKHWDKSAEEHNFSKPFKVLTTEIDHAPWKRGGQQKHPTATFVPPPSNYPQPMPKHGGYSGTQSASTEPPASAYPSPARYPHGEPPYPSTGGYAGIEYPRHFEGKIDPEESGKGGFED